MSAPGPFPPARPTKRRPVTVLIAVVLIVMVGLSGIGIAGLAAWSAFSGGGSEQGLPDPPKSTATVPAPSYPAALAKFYEQELDWRSCQSNQCATLEVPLDYAEPGEKTIEIAVLRVPAARRSQRIGQLVVNPGGPGGSGVDYAASGVASFGEKLTDYFDIVGFDPRGVGESATLQCADTAQTDEFVSADPDPDTPAEVARLDRLTRELGEGCLTRSGDLAEHMSTVEVAKDMDVLRAALGEVQLDYLGASYGTFLGATYADLFPKNVRRMVLDGAVDPSLSNEQLALGQAKGFDTALRAYLADCVAQGDCILGDSVDQGLKRIRALTDQIDKEPLPTSTDRELTQGLATFGIILPLYLKDYWPLLTAALGQAMNGNGDSLLQLSDQYSSRGPEGYLDNSIQAILAVNCLDHSDSIPSSKVPAREAAFEKVSPTLGRLFAYGLSTCAAWPVKSGTRSTALEAEGAPPIVVVGTTRDPATPYEQARSLARQLSSGVLVSRDGDGHTGFGQGNACVDGAVEQYLLKGAVPADGLSC